MRKEVLNILCTFTGKPDIIYFIQNSIQLPQNQAVKFLQLYLVFVEMADCVANKGKLMGIDDIDRCSIF